MRAPTGALAGSEALSPKAPSEGAAGSEIGALPDGRRGRVWHRGYGVTAQSAAELRAWLGILPGWESGSRGDANL